jgi:hypothetical protein
MDTNYVIAIGLFLLALVLWNKSNTGNWAFFGIIIGGTHTTTMTTNNAPPKSPLLEKMSWVAGIFSALAALYPLIKEALK